MCVFTFVCKFVFPLMLVHGWVVFHVFTYMHICMQKRTGFLSMLAVRKNTHVHARVCLHTSCNNDAFPVAGLEMKVLDLDHTKRLSIRQTLFKF